LIYIILFFLFLTPTRSHGRTASAPPSFISAIRLLPASHYVTTLSFVFLFNANLVKCDHLVDLDQLNCVLVVVTRLELSPNPSHINCARLDV
jgi:hypothetical protein